MNAITDNPSTETENLITDIIRNRRTIYADNFINQEIPKELIEKLLTNATWAPTHKRTEPWRFMVLGGTHKAAFGEYMLNYYKEKLTEDQFPPSRYEGTRTYSQNATMIAIIMQRSQSIPIPEWEEIAAISCAVQNLWLSCEAHHIGGYWDTGAASIEYVKNLGLEENERCLGLFYMGYYDRENFQPRSRRKAITKKLTWLED